MPIKIIDADPALLEFRVDGKLEQKDYQQFVPLVESLIKRGGELAMVVHITNLAGFTPSALWEDLKFDAKHYSDISRLALVAETDARKWLASLSKPFTKAEVAFYREDQIEQARQWAKAV
jgi:hypothetical protein